MSKKFDSNKLLVRYAIWQKPLKHSQNNLLVFQNEKKNVSKREVGSGKNCLFFRN